MYLGEAQTIKIFVHQSLSEAANRLRRESFPENYAQDDTCDEFDARALHVVAMSGDAAVGYVRLVPGPESVFKQWFSTPNDVPFSTDSIDANRLCVSRNLWRCRFSLYILTLSYVVCLSRGFRYVIGSAEAGSRMADMLNRIGMVSIGPPIDETEPGGVTLRVQPFVMDLPESIDGLRVTLAASEEKIRRTGRTILLEDWLRELI